MRLKSGVVKGFIPFAINGITSMIIKPESDVVCMLGSNGCGKSAFMGIASPLSGNRNSFQDEGGVEFVYEHEGEDYTLGYTVSGSNLKHFFKRGDTYLNEGSTGKEHDSIAKAVFGYDHALHQCMTGKIRFTEMGPQQRQKYLQSVAEIDITEGEKVYNKLKEKWRDANGAKKHLVESLAKHLQGVIADDEVSQLAYSVDMCHQCMEWIRNNPAGEYSQDAKTLIAKMDKVLIELQEVSLEVIKAPHIRNPAVHIDLDSVSNEVTKLEQIVASHDRNIKTWSGEYAELSPKLNVDSGSVQELIHTTDNKLSSLYEMQANLERVSADYLAVIDPAFKATRVEEALRAISNIYSENLREANLDDCTVTNLNKVTTEFTDMLDRRKRATGRLDSLSSQYRSIVNSRKLKCPECATEFWEEMSDSQLAELKASMDKIDDFLVETQPVEDSLRADSEQLRKHMEALSRIRNVVSCSGEVRLFVESVVLSNTHPSGFHSNVVNMSLLSSVMVTHMRKLEAADSHQRINDDIERTQRLLKSLEEQNDYDALSILTERGSKLETHIKETTLLRNRIKNDLTELALWQKHIERYMGWHKKIHQLIKEGNSYYVQCVNAFKHVTNKRLYDALQCRLASNQQRLNTKSTVDALIEDTQQNLLTVEAKIECLQVLGEVLSPNTGIIADQIQGYLNSFTDAMNDMIAEIWDYDMFIEPCKVDKGKLTYKFPVLVKNYPKPVEDIIKLSDGQKEIVNFMFTLMMIKKSNLTDFPLIVDEIGRALDHKHVKAFFQYLRDLTASGTCSQVMLVSHLFGIMGDFANVDLCVLNGDGVMSLPDNYNKVMTLTY